MEKKYEFVEPTLKVVELDDREIICMSQVTPGDSYIDAGDDNVGGEME